jgi:DNA-binding CsgD family transcriptional regulator
VRIRIAALIGRDAETRIIESSLASAREGRGGALFIVGDAGIGKSRLASMAATAGYDAGMALLRGRSSTIGPMVPYRALTEALLSLLRAGAAPDPAELGPYRPILARLVPDWGPASAVSNAESLVVLAEAVLRLTARTGRDRGCLMILDDLQDADAETLAVLEYLIDNIARQPIVVVAAVRDEPCPALDLARSAAQRGTGTLLRLRPLTRPGLRQLVASYLDTSPEALPGSLADQVWNDSGGNPLLAEELLSGMLSSGLLRPAAPGWAVAEILPTNVPVTLVRTVARRMERLTPAGRNLLSAAAVLGQRFPLAAVRAVTGLEDRELLSQLHSEHIAHLLGPDEQTPDWYSFRHPLVAESLLSVLAPADRTRLTHRAADALEQVYPGLPGEWCQVAATLWLNAGERSRAGRLFVEAGRRALAQGAATSAITLLDKARGLLTRDDDADARAEALATLLYALAEAGQVERALASAAEFGEVTGALDRSARAQLHTRLAWAAMVAGRVADGLAQVDLARSLLRPDASAEDSAPVDVVAAHLALDVPGPNQLREAETMARRAAKIGEQVPLPVVACQAWQLLGALTRHRDPDEATACLERAYAIAVRHDLQIWRIHALIRLGNDDALRDGSVERLEQARQDAARVGAVTARYQADASVALHAILHGDFDRAATLIDQVLASTTRLELLETVQYVQLLRAVLYAHRGRRREMNAALADLRRCNGDHVQHAPRVHGLARAWCALLEENRQRADDEMTRALVAEDRNPTIFHLNGRYGVHLLLRVLDGSAGWSEHRAVTANPASRLRWDRQFSLLAAAVLAGRSGRAEEAAAAMAEAQRTGAPYRTGWHLGLRLVAEAALADGWGEPVAWLRTAEEYFHRGDVPAVASACRSLLRRAGAPVAQRRHGVQAIPAGLRRVGVTVREYEILRLLVGRLSNREIAEQLHLSPRTVEKHVASLLAKTGRPDRVALGEFGLTTLPDPM